MLFYRKCIGKEKNLSIFLKIIIVRNYPTKLLRFDLLNSCLFVDMNILEIDPWGTSRVGP